MIYCVPLPAGVLVTIKSEAEIGNLTENETGVSLQVQSGAVQFRKEILLWYSVQPEIDTLFKAAKKAAADGNMAAAKALFDLSMVREPATADQVRGEIANLANVQKAAEAAKTRLAETEKLAEEERKKSTEASSASSAMTREEQLANYGLAAGLAFITLIALWQIATKEPEEAQGYGRGGGLK